MAKAHTMAISLWSAWCEGGLLRIELCPPPPHQNKKSYIKVFILITSECDLFRKWLFREVIKLK